MSSNVSATALPASGSRALVLGPLLAWSDDPDTAKMVALLGWFAGSMLAASGLAAGAFLSGGSGTPPTPFPVAPAESASAEPVMASASAAPVAQGPAGCPSGTVLVLGGQFKMGSDDPELKDSSPVHEVTLKSFCLDLWEVTAGDYKACVDKGDCPKPPAVPDFPKAEGASQAEHEKSRNTLADFCTFGQEGRERHPINCVTWESAGAYCKFLNKRLPTEAEWEFAARGPESRKFPWGNELGDHTFMNACGIECTSWEAEKGIKLGPRLYDADDGFFRTAPVGSFPKGKTLSGIYDLAGNVWEWTSDWFDAYKAEAATSPTGPATGERKVLRGGAFTSGSHAWVSAAFRYSQLPTATAPGIGFRCAVTP